MPLTIIETDAFPTTVQVPAAGEPASAPNLVSQYLQPAANRLRWLYNRVSVFVNGGTITSSAPITLNGLVIDHAGANNTVIAGGVGGLIVSAGPVVASQNVTANTGFISGGTSQLHALKMDLPVRQPRRIMRGATSGTSFYPIDTCQHVFSDAVMTSGAVWQIDTSTAAPIYGSGLSEWMRFSLLTGSVPVTIKDPNGTVLYTMAFVSGVGYSIDVGLVGGVWTVIDYRYKP